MKQGKGPAVPRASARNYHSGPESEAEEADIRCAAIDERRAVLTAPSRSIDAQKPEPSIERLGALDLRRVLQPASATTPLPLGLRRPPLTAQGSSSKNPKGRKAMSGDVKVQLGSLTPARPPWLGVDSESECEERRKFDVKNSDIEESDFRGSEDIEDGEARAPPGLAARSAMHRAPRRRAKSACSSYRAYLRDSPLRASSLTAMIIMSFGDLIAQAIELFSHQEGQLTGDLRRTALMATYSATVFMPIYFLLYSLMERACAPPEPAALSIIRHSIFVVSSGAPADMLLLLAAPKVEATILGVALPPEVSAASTLVTAGPRLLLATGAFWGSFNVLNFWLVPPGLHLLFSSGASLFWNTYLSNLAHQYLATFAGGGGGAVARRSAAFADEILHLANNVGLQEEVEARAGLAGLSAAGAAGGGSTGKEESGAGGAADRSGRRIAGARGGRHNRAGKPPGERRAQRADIGALRGLEANLTALYATSGLTPSDV
eukprot:CAMPEP_0185284542 /NCGR_PEP_ID=MMETSP1363-20130426/1157_1 /TAXON_ID=38817 /ORGANISM="Gephyrocapsa oceanica, Strain RCC1303" /LENGTH=490 /DNA_ID=CAMNT_0027880263 /DNA_START=37 /DNA_END=1509 /DNA_ORIENTATION=+